ncbi:hypothetical protein L249_2479 [Ophiocordyceps polyrhachis-furcata BCC 54312]|uniref:DUF4604 domain-containing protein n=1 Tax=Ophiocordyceps polyrhachis-furcata BCC 54312 TaxID=1330021 RepID=A0A367LQD6_9HYPO|nr:hypothetical protein L249_2479 [Ophiocordyceps polyrhachis-furcata BCC 54312]
MSSSKLRYDAALPPFLAALRAQAVESGGPDAQASARRRVGHKRSASEEAEDGPLVVDERGHAVDVTDGHRAGLDHDDAVAAAAASSSAAAAGANPPPSSSSSSTAVATAAADGKKEKKPGAIGPRRRRTGRVVGQDADSASEPATPSKPKKKPTKKIKLSFDPDQG